MTKSQAASAGIGRSYFWNLVAGACAYILKPCGLHDHKCSIVLETSFAPGPSIGPGSNSGLMTGFTLKDTAGASQITADWSWYYQWSDFPTAANGVQVDSHYEPPASS